jgi:hypothetical protein
LPRRCPMRSPKVMELKAFFEPYDGRSPRDKLYYWFRNPESKNIKFAPSVYELALALYPDDTIQRKGITEPSRQAIDSTRRYLNILRNWLNNRNLLPYSCVNEKNECLIFDQDRDTVHVVENKLTVLEESAKTTKRKIKRITSMTDKERKIVAKEDDKLIERQYLEYLRKRKKLAIAA